MGQWLPNLGHDLGALLELTQVTLCICANFNPYRLLVSRERSHACWHILYELYFPLGMEMCPIRESSVSLLPSEPSRFISPSFHNALQQYLHFMHLQWAQWQVSIQGLCRSLLRLQTHCPVDLGAGKVRCHFPAQLMDPGGSLHWEASQERLHSGSHDGAEPWCLTVSISTPGPITPDHRRSWHSRMSHSPLCVTAAAVWSLPLGKGWGPGTGSLLPRARHQCCSTRLVVYLMLTVDPLIFFVFVADLLAARVANNPCIALIFR